MYTKFLSNLQDYFHKSILMRNKMSAVLIVEDDKLISDLYKQALTKAGFTPVVVSQVEEGLVELKKGKYDVVLLDLVLPDQTGFSILEQINKDSDILTKVIVTTNFGQSENIEKAYKLGAIDVLLKYNITATEVAEKVKEYLAQSK